VKPGKRGPFLRSMVQREDGPWIVNLGPHSPFVADPAQAPKPTLADLYTATAIGDPPSEVLVTAKETGATVRVRGESMTLKADPGASPAYVKRLWQDARVISGRARRSGRPTDSGIIRDDGEILRVVAELRRAGVRRITLEAIAATSGSFSRDNLRLYLATRNKRLRDFTS
jgi:hypothetical protein